MTLAHLDIRDIRADLPTDNWQIGTCTDKTSVTWHYNGPPVPHQDRSIESWIEHLQGIARYHRDTVNAWKTWRADGICYHFAVLPDGTICQMRDLPVVLWHCGNEEGNTTSIAIHVPLGGNQQPSAAQRDALIDLSDALLGEFRMRGRAAVKAHSEWSKSACPGPHLRRVLRDYRDEPRTVWFRPARPYRVICTTAVQQAPDASKDVALVLPEGTTIEIGALVPGSHRAWIANGTGFVSLDDLTPAPVPPPRLITPAPISVESPIMADARGDPARVIEAICSRPTGEYTRRDIEHWIVPAYFQVCESVGVDPLIALAQMAHETGNLTSWWAARPRRNPAGLGVTGHKSVVPFAGNIPAAFNGAMWEAGISFPSWCQHGIPAHIGRLVAYAVPPEQYTEAQRALVEYALNCRPLESAILGTAPRLSDLAGLWAADPEYDHKLVTWAQRLRGEA
jgi:hypothetical protein